MEIEIQNNQALEQEHTLQPGTYTLGRSSQCDIVLNGNRISRKHALLTITDKGWEVEDLGSANGVFVDGKQIKKKKKLSLNASLSMGGFTFLVKNHVEPEVSKSSRTFGLDSLFSLGGKRPYLTSLCLLLLCCLITVFWMAKINKSYLSAIVLENEINRALSIAENLGHHNKAKWNKSDLAELEISFFEKQQGVIHVFLLDKHGRILAPIDQVNHVLQYPLVEQALISETIEQETLQSGHLLICNPVKNHGEIVGVAVIQYQIRSSVNLLRDRFWQFLFGFIFVLCVAVIFAVTLVKMVLQPWKEVGKSLELTIAENKSMLDYTAPYKEIDFLKTQVDRLLLKSERNDHHDSVVKESPNQNNNGPGVSVKTPTTVKRPLLQETPFREGEISCLIEGETSQLVDSSSDFKKMFQLQETNNLHILEIFQNPMLLTEIMNLVDNRVSKSETVLEDNVFTLTREEVPESPGYLLIRFELKNENNS